MIRLLILLTLTLIWNNPTTHGLVVKSPHGSLFLQHRTADFGPPPYSSPVQSTLVYVNDLCNKYQDLTGKIVITELGCGSFTDIASSAESMGALGVIIGNTDSQDPSLILEMTPYSYPLNIPTVAISNTGLQEVVQRIRVAEASDIMVTVVIDSEGEIASPRDTNPIVEPPNTDQTGLGTGGGDVVQEEDQDVDSGMSIVWMIVGVSVLVKCLIITVACRRRYRSRNLSSSSSCSRARRCGAGASACSSSSSGALLSSQSSEGDVPVVYATYPAPSPIFSVEAVTEGQVDEEAQIGSEDAGVPAVAAAAVATPSRQPFTASALSAYPSIQYTPLMPQATAPSDVYDVEQVIIRG